MNSKSTPDSAQATSARKTQSPSTGSINATAADGHSRTEPVIDPNHLVQRALANPAQLPPTHLLQLQRKIGNQSTARLLGMDTPSAREALLPSAAQVQRSSPAGAEGGELDAPLEGKLRRAQSGGSSLPDGIRKSLEPKLGADLRQVKIHTDSRAVQLARDLNAQAFTHKNHIFYGAGHSPNDLKLTAHETVHTIQQGAVRRMSLQRKTTRNAKENPPAEIGTVDAPQVQRLITKQGLIAVAGAPHEDKKIFGRTVKKMSSAYKRVLEALDRYHGFLSGLPTTEPGGTTFNFGAVARIRERLTELEGVLTGYVESHRDDEVRTPHIESIVTTGIPQERAALQEIVNHSDTYLYKSFADALETQHRVTETTTKVATMFGAQATRQRREVDEEERKQSTNEGRPARPAVSGLSGNALKNAALEQFEREMEEVSSQGKEVTSFDFRGNTQATKLGASVGEELTRPYVSGVLMPALSEAISMPDDMIEIDPVRLNTVNEEQTNAKVRENMGRMRRVYQNFMRTFTPQAARQVPKPFAQFCAEVYDKASEYMDAEHAYLMVSSQIFLRTVNPVLTFTVSTITEGQKGRRAVLLLAKLVQNDANNVKHGSSKEAFLDPLSNISYADQLRNFVMAVVTRGHEQ